MTSAIAKHLHHRTLESFFFEEIEDVQTRTGRSLPREVEAYVVGLLARYARRTQAAGRASPPLALDYLSARREQGSKRAYALRGVGDRALYISGVAPRSLVRSAVNVSYVKGIGEACYREVSDRVGALAVLGMLAERFDEVSEVIGEVVELGSRGGDDLLSIYERWREFRDDRDLKRLVSAGVLIDPEGSDTLQ
jgi:hypothetical protein